MSSSQQAESSTAQEISIEKDLDIPGIQWQQQSNYENNVIPDENQNAFVINQDETSHGKRNFNDEKHSNRNVNNNPIQITPNPTRHETPESDINSNDFRTE